MPTYQFLSLRLETGGQAFRLTVFARLKIIMAIYHLNVRYCSKSKGQSAKAKSEYINRLDKYSNRLDDLQFSGFGNMPKFAENNPQKFWQASDLYERENARVCTEIVVALPKELTEEQQQNLVRSFINNTVNSDKNKLPYSFAIHNDKDGNNPHCHLIFSERKLDGIERTEEQFFKRANSKHPEKGGAMKTTDFRDREFIQLVRQTWREQANQALAMHGHAARIDERSYKDQGIEQVPRSRLDRVTWLELNQLERESQSVGKKLAQMGQEIAQKQKINLNAPKNAVERFFDKPEQSIRQKEKTLIRGDLTLSQRDFDLFLIDNWLEPNKKFIEATERLDKLKGEFDSYDKDLNRIQASYNELHDKNQGFLGLWQSKEQKQQIQALESEYSQKEREKISKGKEYQELNEKINQYEKNVIEPLRKQIEQMKADNPHLMQRNHQQLIAMKFKGVDEWRREKLQREQSQKRQSSQGKERGLSL